MKYCISRLCTSPFTHVRQVRQYGGNSHFASLAQVFTGPRQGYRLQKTSFGLLVGIYCHNIPTHTPQSGYHGFTEVAKTTNIAKMAEKCINCTSTRPTPLHTNPRESGPGDTLSAQNRKKQKIHDFRPRKGGGPFFDIFDPHPPRPSLKSPKKWVSSGGGGGGGPDHKLIGGCVLLAKMMIFQEVKQTIQPLEVGYVNSPKKAQRGGGHVAFSPTYGPSWL